MQSIINLGVATAFAIVGRLATTPRYDGKTYEWDEATKSWVLVDTI